MVLHLENQSTDSNDLILKGIGKIDNYKTYNKPN